MYNKIQSHVIKTSYLAFYFSSQYPCITSTIPREIKPLPWYLQSHSVIAMGGVLPFGAAYVELFFILSSIWMEQVSLSSCDYLCPACSLSRR